MARWVRHGVGIGIIAAGFCAALQFRIDAPGDSLSVAPGLTQSSRSPASDITLQLAPRPVTEATSEPEPRPAEPVAPQPQVDSRSALSAAEPPPSLAADYQSFKQHPATPSGTRPEATVERQAAEARTHTIRDGDSLEAIAQRYLGDAGRWQEVLEANPDVLTSRDLLPVNAVVKIPASTIAKRPPNSGSPEDRYDDELVPVHNR